MKTLPFNKLALAVAFTGAALVGCESDYSTSAVKAEDTATSQGGFMKANLAEDTSASYQLAQADTNEEPTATDRYGVDNQMGNQQEEYGDTESSFEQDNEMEVSDAQPRSEESWISSNGEEQTVEFEFDSDELSDDARDNLKDFVQSMEQDERSPVKISIKGYTDQHGPEEYNQDLAQRRAEAVRDFLQEEGLTSNNFEIEAVGEPEGDELADNAQQNRRVVISIEASDEVS